MLSKVLPPLLGRVAHQRHRILAVRPRQRLLPFQYRDAIFSTSHYSTTRWFSHQPADISPGTQQTMDGHKREIEQPGSTHSLKAATLEDQIAESDILNEGGTANNNNDDSEKSTKIFTTTAHDFGTEHPKQELKTYYLNHFQEHPLLDSEAYKREFRFDEQGKQWWTASFICPVTESIFMAGSLNQMLPRMYDANGKVFYTKSKQAVAAASARAIDQIEFHQKGILEPRLCLEDPSMENQQLDIETIQEMISADPSVLSIFDPSLDEDDNDGADEDGTGQVATGDNVQILKKPPPVGFTIYDDHDDEDGEEDLILRDVEGSGAADVGQTTFERIMDAWAESHTSSGRKLQQSITDTAHHETHMLPLSSNPNDERASVISDAEEWYETMASTKERKGSRNWIQFQTSGMDLSVGSGNAILNALANVKDLPTTSRRDVGSNKKLEEIASRVIDLLWKNSAEGRGESPNVHTYNAYLRCIGGPTRQRTAQRGYAFLDNMCKGTSKHDRVLPKPNAETFNIVIQSWSNVGSKKAQQKILELQSLLKDMQTDNSELLPNRETYLSILSSMTALDYKTSSTYFDPDAARELISEMNQAYSRTANESLRPDTEVFNAPLRWCGGSTQTSYAKTVPWDNYSVLFDDGFRDQNAETDALVDEAKLVEEWLHQMESPDIRTHESVIQAWVRTCTLEGVTKAESWALRLLEDPVMESVKPRLQTFHPIIAAWAYSGDERGPKKVQEWNDRLEKHSRSIPEIQPDGRVRGALVTAWRNYQKILLKVHNEENASSRSDSTLLPKLVDIANTCASSLKGLCNASCQPTQQKDPLNLFIEGHLFSEVVKSWTSVIQHSHTLDSNAVRAKESCEEALSQVFLTAKLLDDTIHYFRSMEIEEKDPDLDDEVDGELEQEINFEKDWRSRQLRHLIYSAPNVHTKCLAIFAEVDGTLVESSKSNSLKTYDGPGKNTFSRFLFEIENILRRSEEYGNFLNRCDPQDDFEVVYEDLFSYNFSSASSHQQSHKRLALYREVVAGCSSLTSLSHVGDAVRLCMFTLEALKHSIGEFEGYERDITNLYSDVVSVLGKKVFLKPKERIMILNFVRDHMNSIDEGLAAHRGGSTSNVLDMKPTMKKIQEILEYEHTASSEVGGGHSKNRYSLTANSRGDPSNTRAGGKKRKTKLRQRRRRKKASQV